MKVAGNWRVEYLHVSVPSMQQALRIRLFAAYIVWLWSLEKVLDALSAYMVPLLRLFRATRYARLLAENNV